VAARGEFPDMAAFRRAILALPLEFSLAGSPHVKLQSLRGKTLDFTYGQARDNSTWPLFSSPFLDAAKDSEMLVMKYHDMRRTLDFRQLTVK
jgi:hypothetical protein